MITASQYDTLTQCWFNAGPPSETLAKHWTNIRAVYHVCCAETISHTTPNDVEASVYVLMLWWKYFWEKIETLEHLNSLEHFISTPSTQSVVYATQMSGIYDTLCARGSIWDTALRAIYYYCDGSFTLCQSHTLLTEHHKQSGTLPGL